MDEEIPGSPTRDSKDRLLRRNKETKSSVRMRQLLSQEPNKYLKYLYDDDSADEIEPAVKAIEVNHSSSSIFDEQLLLAKADCIGTSQRKIAPKYPARTFQSCVDLQGIANDEEGSPKCESELLNHCDNGKILNSVTKKASACDVKVQNDTAVELLTPLEEENVIVKNDDTRDSYAWFEEDSNIFATLDATLLEVESINHTASKRKKGSKESPSNEAKIQKSLSENAISEGDFTVETTNFIGFKTASKKDIRLSKEAQDKAAKILKSLPDIAERNTKTKEAYPGRGERGNDSVLELLTPPVEEQTVLNTTMAKVTANRVTPSSSHYFDASDSWFEEDSNIFATLDATLLEVESTNHTASKRKKGSKESPSNDTKIQKSLPKKAKEAFPGSGEGHFTSETTNFIGFKTASKKDIRLSKEAQDKAAKILKSLPDIAERNTKTKEAYPGRGERGNDSVLELLTPPVEEQTVLNTTMAKVTANRVTPSSSHYFDASDSWFEEDSNIFATLDATLLEVESANQTASKRINGSCKVSQLKEAKILKSLTKYAIGEGDFTVETTNFIGFKTASKRDIRLSKEAQDKAAKILKSLPDIAERNTKTKEAYPV